MTIDGEQYENLAKVAASMNRAAWTDGDNTAQSVFENFAFTMTEQFLNAPNEMAEDILECVATGENGQSVPSPLHEERIAELRAAFKTDGLL
ncbi:MAG: hypothetical protein IKO01_10000 [Kiritimatiellae bacterium]|nr:hypothetical protein [Kiritimatiellia bacterium]